MEEYFKLKQKLIRRKGLLTGRGFYYLQDKFRPISMCEYDIDEVARYTLRAWRSLNDVYHLIRLDDTIKGELDNISKSITKLHSKYYKGEIASRLVNTTPYKEVIEDEVLYGNIIISCLEDTLLSLKKCTLWLDVNNSDNINIKNIKRKLLQVLKEVESNNNKLNIRIIK